jgi:biopolymer transport protein ExbB
MDFFMHSMELFHKGGFVMYGLLLCSLTVVAIATERFLYYRHTRLPLTTFREKMQPLLEQHRWEEAQKICEKSVSAVEQVTAEGLKAFRRGRNAEHALENAAALVASRLRERLGYLSTVVTLAPLLGLLGTVVGMINSFSVFNVQAGEPMAITGGVGEALIATATGLCVAMLALLFHTYLVQRLDALITDIEQAAALVLAALPPAQGERRERHEIA